MIKYFKPLVHEGKYGGHTLKVSIEDPLALGWYGKDWERLPEIEILSKGRLKPGAKVFDLGAHQSVVAMMLAKEVGDSGKVLAVEANLHNYQVGKRNIDLNKLSNVKLVHGAIGERNGELEFSEDLNGAVRNQSTTTQSFKVEAITVDTLIEKNMVPDVIFMDIEGFEVHALKAAQKALELQADWFVEIHGPELIGRFGGTVEDVMAHFPMEKYDIYLGNKETSFGEYKLNKALLEDHCYMVALSK